MSRYQVTHTDEIKIKVVGEYLSGGVSRAVICAKYGIKYPAVLSAIKRIRRKVGVAGTNRQKLDAQSIG